MTFSYQDADNIRRNRVTIGGGNGPAYNAVLSFTTSDEGADTLTLSEVKAWCYIDNSDFDTLLNMLIPAAREVCETYVNLSFIDRTVTAHVINDLGGITLPLGPVNGEVAVTDDEANEIENYTLRKPNTTGEVIITYAAGFETLPQMLKLAWLNQILYMFDNRDKSDVAPQAMAILKPLRNV